MRKVAIELVLKSDPIVILTAAEPPPPFMLFVSSSSVLLLPGVLGLLRGLLLSALSVDDAVAVIDKFCGDERLAADGGNGSPVGDMCVACGGNTPPAAADDDDGGCGTWGGETLIPLDIGGIMFCGEIRIPFEACMRGLPIPRLVGLRLSGGVK